MQSNPTLTPDELTAVGAACPAFNIRKASRTITRLYAAAFAAVDLEPTQFTLLIACSRQPAVTMTALAARLSMDASALARNVAVLERRGLLKVEPDGDDRRVRLVSISSSGKNRLARVLPHWQVVQRKLADQFGPDQFRLAVDLMKTMTRAGESLLNPSRP